MESKMIGISVRVPREDADFISMLQINGAKTPSDKLRVIISEARQRLETKKGYQVCRIISRDFFEPAISAIRKQEMEAGVHSEMLTRTFDWLQDTMAYLVSTGETIQEGNATDNLVALENGLADRLFRLIESTLQMGVTRHCACYNPDSVSSRLEPVLELSTLIDTNRKIQKGEKK